MKKKALITGITGQDGSYLAELLLDKGYEVHGIIRRSSGFNTQRIDHIFDTLHLHHGDMTDSLNITSIIRKVEPGEIYNLAAQSHVKVSFELPHFTSQVDAIGALNVMEATRFLGFSDTRIYHASTSEMFGKVQEIPQKETTPFYPRSPYGVSKLYSYWMTVNYREAYDMFACTGILFNHESPRRGPTFVTKKIVDGLRRISFGYNDIIKLGNLNAKRDWGHAKDYVKAMWLMLQQDVPDDYVIATGEQYSVREFVEKCCPYFNIDLEWKNTGISEIGIDKRTNKVIIEIDEKYFRPTEVDTLLGDSTKARKELGWSPEYSFNDLVKDMCCNAT